VQSGTPLWRSAAFPRLIHDQKERTELSHDFPSPNFVHQAIKNADASLSQAQHCHGMRMWKLAATIPRGPHSSRKTGRLLPPSSSFHSFHTFNPSNILEQAQMPCTHQRCRSDATSWDMLRSEHVQLGVRPRTRHTYHLTCRAHMQHMFLHH
jgi:hypothetical protein